MPVPDTQSVITQTKKWITDVVVGCNFCPFAARELKRNSIHYEVLNNAVVKSVLEMTMKMLQQLDKDTAIETSFLILPGCFESFDKYLQLLDIAETLLAREKYEGIYQLAGFHPGYLFSGSNETDPANYTNRSPYPMIHLLREESISRAVDNYPGNEKIPGRNIEFANKKGLLFMKQLLGTRGSG